MLSARNLKFGVKSCFRVKKKSVVSLFFFFYYLSSYFGVVKAFFMRYRHNKLAQNGITKVKTQFFQYPNTSLATKFHLASSKKEGD